VIVAAVGSVSGTVGRAHYSAPADLFAATSTVFDHAVAAMRFAG